MNSPPRAIAGTTRLGWIGTGVMGASMAGRLLDAGFGLTVFSRTRAKAEELVERGAVWADSPAAVAAASDVIFTMVGYPHDVRSTVLGPAGTLSSAAAGAVHVDMTTSEPSLAVEIASAARDAGQWSLDAPVSGGDVGARNGTLSVMAGGDAAAFEAVRPCLEGLGGTIVLQGGPGAGQHTKMVNQTLIAGTMTGMCEALAYAEAAGLDATRVLESVGGGAAGSWSLTNLAPRILAGDFAPGFYVEHFVKDLGIALAEARRVGVVTPGLALTEQLYRSLERTGRGRDGTQALIHAITGLSGLGPGPTVAKDEADGT
ncbi:MAG: NAD(P)-dependent oxidoreductase [Planctomycetota bacterium]